MRYSTVVRKSPRIDSSFSARTMFLARKGGGGEGGEEGGRGGGRDGGEREVGEN